MVTNSTSQIIAENTVGLVLLVLEDEGEVLSDFDIKVKCQDLGANKVKVSGCYTVNAYDLNNEIEGYIESVETIYQWSDFSFVIDDITETRKMYDLVYSELDYMCREYAENTKNKN